jgi:NAD-dependent deacetylase
MPPFSDHLIRRLRQARRVGVLTGAGISAESGVPTFRDPDGLWQRFKPEELANVQAFLTNPTLVQGWYAHRRAVVEDVEPNAGHYALAELERYVTEKGGDFLLATQNVDGLHARAGSERIAEVHGSLTRTYCIDCETPATDENLAALAAGSEEAPPVGCDACGGLLRPDVVWFGEMLPMDVFAAAERSAASADVYLSVGTSAVVYPAAGLPLLALQNGAYVAEINPVPSDNAGWFQEQIPLPAGEALPALLDAVKSAA